MSLFFFEHIKIYGVLTMTYNFKYNGKEMIDNCN